MQYTIKARTLSDPKLVASTINIKSVGDAFSKVFEMLEYGEDLAEVVIFSEEAPVYSIKAGHGRQFIVTELF